MSTFPSFMASTAPYFTYTWSVPSISAEQEKLLCHGYGRENCTSTIPQVIINLFSSYFRPNDMEVLNKIKNATKGERFESPVFNINGIKWTIGIYPNGFKSKRKAGDVFLCLSVLSTLTRHSSAKVCFTLQVIHSGNRISPNRTHRFVEYSDTFTEPTSAIKLRKLQSLAQLTITLRLQCIELYDVNGRDLLQRMMNENNYKQQLQSQQSEIEQLKYKLQILQRNNDEKKRRMRKRDSKQFNEFKTWLNNEVELPQYTNLFITNGVEDLLTVKLVTMDTLNEIGIRKIGHKLKILHFVNKLNERNHIGFGVGNKRPFKEILNDDDINQQSTKKQKIDS